MNKEIKFSEKIDILKKINKNFNFEEINFHNEEKSAELAKFIDGHFYRLFFYGGELLFRHPMILEGRSFDVLCLKNIEDIKSRIHSIMNKMKIKSIFEKGRINDPNSIEYFSRSSMKGHIRAVIIRIFEDIEQVAGNAFQGKETVEKLFCCLKNKVFTDSTKTMGDLIILLMMYEVLDYYEINEKDIYPNYRVIQLNQLNYILVDKRIGDFFYFENETKMVEYLLKEKYSLDYIDIADK